MLLGADQLGKLQQVTACSYAYWYGQAALVDAAYLNGKPLPPAEQIRACAKGMLETADKIEQHPEDYADTFGVFNRQGERWDGTNPVL